MDNKFCRRVQASVTNFLFYGDEYLFLKRGIHKRIDPGRVNGIGGKVEPGEDYLTACIRETKEETGYEIKPSQIQLAGVIRLEDFYDEDWIMCFFKIKLDKKDLSLGNQTDDGELIWLHKDEVLSGKYEMVDDLYYCFDDIVEGKEQFFISAKVGQNFKITTASIRKLPL